MNKANTRLMILSALFTALIAITAQVSIPIPYVPINLALLAVHLAGAVLGPRYGLACVAAYLLLGAAGLPVFSGFRGGAAVIAGNTGGYLAGYAVCVFLTGALCKRRRQMTGLWLGMVPGTLACYTLGAAWLATAARMPFAAALAAGVLPFLPGDLAKILLAGFLTQRLRNIPAVRIALRRPDNAVS